MGKTLSQFEGWVLVDKVMGLLEKAEDLSANPDDVLCISGRMSTNDQGDLYARFSTSANHRGATLKETGQAETDVFLTLGEILKKSGEPAAQIRVSGDGGETDVSERELPFYETLQDYGETGAELGIYFDHDDDQIIAGALQAHPTGFS